MLAKQRHVLYTTEAPVSFRVAVLIRFHQTLIHVIFNTKADEIIKKKIRY